VVDCFADVATPQQQISDTVVERNVGFVDVLIQLRQNLRVRVECLVELLLLLVFERSLLELATSGISAWRAPRQGGRSAADAAA